jgi:hypothetical protein
MANRLFTNRVGRDMRCRSLKYFVYNPIVLIEKLLIKADHSERVGRKAAGLSSIRIR